MDGARVLFSKDISDTRFESLGVGNNFIFSVKAPRYITHIKRLREVEEPIANFFASGVLQLKNKLGSILRKNSHSIARLYIITKK